MFVYSAISCEEMRCLAHLPRLRQHLEVPGQAGRDADRQAIRHTCLLLSSLVTARNCSSSYDSAVACATARRKASTLNVVGEAPSAVDLDDRQPLPVGLLEGLVAGDVDLAQLEAELVAQRPHLLERALAEVAALGVVDDDLRAYG